MAENKNSIASNLLKLNFYEQEQIGLTQQNTLRKVVGLLGMGLPLLLYLFVLVDSGYATPLPSISHYYFTRASSVFCVVVSLMAIFLIIYKGKEPIDFYLSCIAGIFAFCLVLFPTDNLTTICCDADKKYVVTLLRNSDTRTGFHYIASAIFLLCLACMSIFVFTKSDKPKAFRTKQKKARNSIYRICGGLMIAALLVVFCGGFLGWIPSEQYDANHLTFWMETLAIEAFGFSWLVKGKSLLKDDVSDNI